MPCYHPQEAYRRPGGGVSFSKKGAFHQLPITLPCGQCVGCRLNKSLEWAIRCVHEASLYDNNSFVTLTYNDDHLPNNRSLSIRTHQLFLKRFRKKYGKHIRFYLCGEYGAKFRRPHYHILFFNHDFDDKVPLKRGKDKEPLYRSPGLEQIWPYGYSSTGAVTFESAAYVARYIMKKRTGKNARNHYQILDPDTGEILHELLPEYTAMSRGGKTGLGGIATKWIEDYSTDAYPHNFIIHNGAKKTPPKFYDKKYEITHPSDYKDLQIERKKQIRKHKKDLTPERLYVREVIALSQLSSQKRELS